METPVTIGVSMSINRTDQDLLHRIGRRIADARKAIGLTQADLAEKADTEAATLSRWETGARAPSITALAKLAEALGIGVGDLVDESDRLRMPVETQLAAVLAQATEDERHLIVRLAAEVVRRSA